MNKFLPILFSAAVGSAFCAEGRKFSLSVKNAPEGSVRAFEVQRSERTVGNVRSTAVEIMFENQTDRILEGDFEFSLEDGETVVGYSLDINGKMRKGVAVEKEKARTVFESEVRKGVDPGFVEKTAGNSFKTRVYPIPARGIRKIEIVFEKELTPAESDSEKVFTQTIGKDTYFYFYEKIADSESRIEKPKEITVLFDVSDSAKNRDIKKEIEFLRLYSEKLGNPNVKIVAFANSIVEEFNARGDFSRLLEFDLDGATNLSQDFGTLSGDVILFSDGIENWGGRSKFSLSSGRVVAVSSSASANFANLRRISAENNGIFINLFSSKTEDAVEKMFENPLRVLGVEFSEKEISDVYPIQGEIVDGGISVSGILKKKSGKVKISVGRNGKAERTIERKISAVESETSVESDIAGRLWAMKKIAALESDHELNRKEIVETAKKFTVVTDETSLIVLDNASQYAQHGIEPPEDLKAEYDRIVARGVFGKVADSANEGIPKSVYTKFEEFKKWWKKTPEQFAEEATPKPIIEQPRLRGRVSTAEVEVDAMVMEDAAAIPEQRMVEERMAANSLSAAPQSVERSAMAKAAGSAKVADMNAAAAPQSSAGTIALREWTSDAEYLSVLKKTATEKMYAKYLELKKTFGASPAFYMEVSDYFMEEELKAEAVRILSNLAEMELENSDILRALGNKLVERGEYALAIPIFERLTKIRAEIPQFYRDLGLAHALSGDREKAVEALWKVASRGWDSRFNEIQQTALNDMNAILASMDSGDAAKIRKALEIDKRLVQNFDVDVRVVLTWNMDDCDVDLWVTDPNGEKCYYGHKQTRIGGRMSRDFTQGYGPEEFCIRNAKKGTYKIEANYFGTRQQKLLQPVTVQAEVYTNFGRPDQKREVLTLQLKNVRGTFEVGEIEF